MKTMKTGIVADINKRRILENQEIGIRQLYGSYREESRQMLQNLYRWIQDLAVWLVISAAALQALPGKNYGKYVRFFTGLVTVLLLISPILKLTGTDQTLEELWSTRQQEEQQAEEEKFQKLLEEASAFDLTGTRAPQNGGNEESFTLGNEKQVGESGVETNAGSSGEQNAEAEGNKELTDAAASRIRVEEIEIGK